MTIDVQNGGKYRGQRISLYNVGIENHDEYTCTANALNHESVQNFFTINVISRWASILSLIFHWSSEEANETTADDASTEEEVVEVDDDDDENEVDNAQEDDNDDDVGEEVIEKSEDNESGSNSKRLQG